MRNSRLFTSPETLFTANGITPSSHKLLPLMVMLFQCEPLGVSTNDKIAFVIQPQGTVEVKTPKYPTISSLAGAAGRLKKPLAWKEVERLAHEDHVEEIMKDLR